MHKVQVHLEQDKQKANCYNFQPPQTVSHARPQPVFLREKSFSRQWSRRHVVKTLSHSDTDRRVHVTYMMEDPMSAHLTFPLKLTSFSFGIPLMADLILILVS